MLRVYDYQDALNQVHAGRTIYKKGLYNTIKMLFDDNGIHKVLNYCISIITADKMKRIKEDAELREWIYKLENDLLEVE